MSFSDIGLPDDVGSFAGDPDAVAGPAVNGAGLAVEVNSDGTAPVFDIASGQEIGTITLPTGPPVASPISVAFVPGGNYLISATEGATGPPVGSARGGEITKWNFSSATWSHIACATAGHTAQAKNTTQLPAIQTPARVTAGPCALARFVRESDGGGARTS